MSRSERKVIVITRQTRADELIRRFNTLAQAEFYVTSRGGDFSDYQEESVRYKAAVAASCQVIENLARMQRLDREYVPAYIFGPDDIVVVIGQDGLVANTVKYLHGQPLIAVNPDPARYDGVLLPFVAADVKPVLLAVLAGRFSVTEVTMAQASLGDGQSMLAVNDFFIGRTTHVSARYSLQVGKMAENQSSSGIIVSTGLGRTGWLKSVVTGASAVAAALGADPVGDPIPSGSSQWGSDTLYYSVREPFPSRVTGTSLVFGQVSKAQTLQVTSQMPENGVIFSDGVEDDFLRFTSGVTARISIAGDKGQLVT